MAVSCRNCGNSMNDEARFCSVCGTPAAAQQSAQAYPPYPGAGYQTVSRLIRPRAGRMVAGVCQGLANSYGWDVTWVRVITVLLTIFGGGLGLIAYVVFWIVMPEEPLALPKPNAWGPQSPQS
jgi:phage shock protein C